MTGPDLSVLFEPRGVAVVGASPDRHYSRSIIANLRQHGFPEDAIHLVNPRYETIDGLVCHPSLAELPTRPDVVALLIGRGAVPSAIADSIACGARAALVIADGYAEEGSAGLLEQQALGAIARDAELALLGPNTLGYVVPGTGAGLWCAGTLPQPLRPGGIAVLAQSSGMLNLVMSVAGQRAIGIRAAVSLGNAEVVGLPELVDHFVEDPACTTLGMVVESIDRPRDLMTALGRAMACGKAVVVLKIGTSDLGRRNSVAHTGRLAGPGQGWATLFERLGVCAVRDMDDFLETLTLFGGLGAVADELPDRPDGLGVALATISGGETSLICDIAEQEGLRLAGLAEPTLDKVRAALGKPSMIGNPMDLQNTRGSRPEVFWGCIEQVCADPSVDVLAVRLQLSVAPTPSLRQAYRDVVALARAAGVLPVVLTRAYEHLDLAWWSFFAELEVPFVLSYRNAVRAFVAFNRWLVGRQQPTDLPGTVPATPVPPVESVALDLAELRDWMRAAGISYVANAEAGSPVAAASAAVEMGFPVVLKAVAPGLVHKSDVGGVALGLSSADAVEQAATAIRERVSRKTGADASTIGFEVQRMVEAGPELIVGMTADPSWGPVMMVGSGGIHAETMGDVVWELPPIDRGRARTMLRRLRSWPILDGARGRGRADVEALVALLVAFSDALVRAPDHLEAVDLNPVLVGPEGTGAVVVDASVLVHRRPLTPGC